MTESTPEHQNLLHPSNPWTVPSSFSLSQAELHDYISTRLGKPAKRITSYENLLNLLEKERTPDSFLLISEDAVKALDTFTASMNSGESFAVEMKDDGCSGVLTYKTMTVGGIVFSASINVLTFVAPGEAVAFIATVTNYQKHTGPEQLTISTFQTGMNPEQNLVHQGLFSLNDASGCVFTFKTGAEFLCFIPSLPSMPAEETGTEQDTNLIPPTL